MLSIAAQATMPANTTAAARARVLENGGTGPYRAIMMEQPGFPEHTVFRPINLSPFSKTNALPILVWGNGACANSPIEHAKFLSEIASHGYLVLATGIYPENDRPYRGPMSRPEQQIESIDWAFAGNADPKSEYFGKLDLKHICLAGMSCGGLQALHNCAEKRISAVMICNSGLFTNPAAAMPNMPMPRKEKLRDLHTPVIYILTSPQSRQTCPLDMEEPTGILTAASSAWSHACGLIGSSRATRTQRRCSSATIAASQNAKAGPSNATGPCNKSGHAPSQTTYHLFATSTT